MALYDDLYGTPAPAPAPAQRRVQPVVMPQPAASAPAPDPLVAAMQTMKANGVAPDAVASTSLPRQAGESPRAYDQRMARAREEADKTAREAANPQIKNESQGNALAFGMRMKEANSVLNDMEDKGITNTGAARSVVSGILGAVPAIGGKLEEKTSSAMNILPTWAGGPSPEQQQVEQARRNFITAVLRKESGATISPEEFYSEEKKYFPQLGDSQPVILQKRAARDLAIRAMDIQSGNKAPNAAMPGAQPPTSTQGSDPLMLRRK